MDGEILKQKYRKLYNELNYIKNKVNLLNDSYNELMINIKNGILVDDKVVMDDVLSLLIFDNNKILSELDSTVLPSIKNMI